MWFYSAIIHMFLIFECRARQDEFISVDDVLNKYINNITKLNLDSFYSIKDAHNNIAAMDTEEIVSLGNSYRNEFGNNVRNNDKNHHFLNALLNDQSSRSFETISINPKTRNGLNILQNTLNLYKRTIPERNLKQAFKQKQKNSKTKQQRNNIWKSLPIKLNTLIQNYDENLSFRDSKEDKKPMIIILANSDKTYSSENDRSDIKELESSERIKAFLRAGCVNCVKAQVKKCFKALKDCTKVTCATYHCKSSFKKSFVANSRKGCIAEFSNDEDNQNGNKKNISAVIYVNHPDNPPRLRKLVNLNLNCEDEDDSYPRSMEKLLSSMTSNTGKSINVLRDKYEKACKIATAKKCNKVCITVITITCLKHKCKKNQVKAFKKDCKKSCTTVFGVPKSSESSDSGIEEDEEDEDESD